MDISSYHLELWQIVIICLVMVPAFFFLNYLVVMYAARARRSREDRVERAIAAGVARDMNPENKFKKKRRRKF